MRIQYIAEDGKEFESKEACRKYEISLGDDLKENESNILIWDEYGNKKVFFFDDPFILSSCYFLRCKTVGAVKLLQRYAQSACSPIPSVFFSLIEPEVLVGITYMWEDPEWQECTKLFETLCKVMGE